MAIFCEQVLKQPAQLLEAAPEHGCYIHGLYVEGAKWDAEANILVESRPKELFTEMPAFWFYPEVNRKQSTEGIYVCPLYKTLQRAGKTINIKLTLVTVNA